MVFKVMKKIGIRYCGGCNPTYERLEMGQRVRVLLEDRHLFLPHDQQEPDVFILINGCPRSCAEKNLDWTDTPYLSIGGENDFEGLIDWLISLDKS